MSSNRISPDAGWANQSKMPKGPNGRNLCRWCNQEVPKGKRTFCSEACVDQHKIRTNPGYVRQLVLERDKGVCARCGLDTVAFEKFYNQLRHEMQNQHSWHYEEPFRQKLKELTGCDWAKTGYSFWQADHILEVVNGGGECGLENYQTLCVPCHKDKTKAMHAARKASRATAKQLTFGEPER